MLYKQLNRTIERITSRHYENETGMLISVLDELTRHPSMNISGGRIWQLYPDKGQYVLIHQTGRTEKLTPRFKVRVKDYPDFAAFLKERTIFSNEINEVLRKKGIFKYAATGVGQKIKIEGGQYYEYLLAFNSKDLTLEFKYLLNILAAVLTAKLKQRHTVTRQKFITEDLKAAHELQKSILPQHDYSFHDYEIFGISIPAETIGGDFFDYLELGTDKERIGIALGDAASKGVAAAAEAMYISGALRMASTFEIKIVPLMQRLNRLVNKIFGDDKFSSLFYGEISNDMGGLFIYANAGHNPPMFLKKNQKEIVFLNPTGPVLGPTANAKYTLSNINFDAGDVLVIFSDGLIESTNAEYDLFGDERLQRLFLHNADRSAKEIAVTLIDEVQKFNKSGAYSDDKTIVVIKKRDI